MVDPLDGTTGFIQGNGDFAVQIGLVENGECVVGVVYQPLSGVLYRATRGGGSWVERPQLPTEAGAVSERTKLAGDAVGGQPFSSQPAHEQGRNQPRIS